MVVAEYVLAVWADLQGGTCGMVLDGCGGGLPDGGGGDAGGFWQ